MYSQTIKNHNYTQQVLIIPYRIEEALDDLKDGEVEKIQYTYKNKKYLLRYNENMSHFEYSNFKNRSWNICERSYLRMKAWTDIQIYEESTEEITLVLPSIKINNRSIEIEEYIYNKDGVHIKGKFNDKSDTI